MNLSDYLVSVIRTGVAVVVGVVASWAVRHGLNIDAASATAYVTPIAIAAYYALVRLVETKYPQAGFLLGVPKAPAYNTPPVPPGPVVTITAENQPAAPMSAALVTRIIDETVVEGQRLGRHVLHDARSLGYLARDLIDPKAPLAPKLWPFPGKPLDQGQLGSCVGNATAHLLRVHQGKVGKLNEAEARRIYSLATQLDGTPGYWKPRDPHSVDTGTDGLSGLKAAQQLGLFLGDYRWCLGLDDVLAVLSQHGPTNLGIPWYEGFDKPNSSGLITIAGSPRGGHEVCSLGVDPTKQEIRLVQSWGDWGPEHGFFQMSFATLDRLLHEQGDAATIG